MQYYIGLNDRTTDGVYVWNSETTAVGTCIKEMSVCSRTLIARTPLEP